MADRRDLEGSVNRFEYDGDTYGLGDVLDFSSNLNPLGMPMQVVRALKVAASGFEAYPDPFCRDLTGALAASEEVEADAVVVTAGASDAFARIAAALKPHRALVCSPCYAGYERALRPLWPRVVHHSLVVRENFDVTDRIIDYIEPDIDCVFLATPNNPTGRTIPRDLMCKVLRAADRWGTYVVVDESFLGFSQEHSCVSLIDRYPHLIVVKSFSKTHAMAGFRLGYAVCGSADVVRAMRAAGPPWAVSSPAQVAGLAAIDVPGYLDLTRDYVAEGRAALEAGLREAGMLVVESQASFVLFQSPAPLYDGLLERGFLVRRCEDFRGLDRTWYRVAVRKHDENARLLDAVREVIA